MSESIEMRAIRWLSSNDTGTSSTSILKHMMGLSHDMPWGVSEPSDGGDLGRCLRLLALIPEWESRIPEMAALSNAWAALVPHWGELKNLMIEETGPTFDRDKRAPKTYQRIKEITAKARADDGWVSFGKGMSIKTSSR